MEIQLIPVIEVTYYDESESPANGPYWEYEDEWEAYSKERLKKAGFEDEFEPYKKGSSFYEPDKISPRNLKKLIQDMFDDWDGTNLDLKTPFYGGYVLNVNNDDVFFPQCCGDLGDLIYWRKLAYQNEQSYYHGHPEPIITFENSLIHFEFNEYYEEFHPSTIETISFPKDDLRKAYEYACLRLKSFEDNILTVFSELKLDIDRKTLIDILIYKNDENK